MRRIDLNADVGEAFGAYAFGHDAQVMRSITSASIAAGFHAGDPSVIRATVRLAREHGVSIGAHPAFPDLVGFGRRELKVDPQEAEDLVLYQIAAVAGIASAEGVRLQHVKPHGALYNMAAHDSALAGAIVRAIAAADASLVLFGPPDSALLNAGRAAGLQVAAEAFPDRAYDPSGRLAFRGAPGAMIHDPVAVAERAVRIATEQQVPAIDGSVIPLRVDTLCIHGDAPDADRVAHHVRRALDRAGVLVRAVGLP
jgi:5-oxoprolinase (ATP-hydrolysing) subunit A